MALLAIFVANLLIKCAIHLYMAKKKRSKVINRPRIFTRLPINETVIDVERTSTPVVRFKEEEMINLDSKNSLNPTDEIADVFEGTSRDLNSREIRGKTENILKQANSFKRSFCRYFLQEVRQVLILDLNTLE
jgi:hypothetical protein